jgi:hypothetical protein
MRPRRFVQAIALGGFLVLVGVLLLLQSYLDVSAWVWLALMLLGGLVALGFYVLDPADRTALITAYALLAIALLVALIMLNGLRDEAVAVYVLVAVAVPFLAANARDQTTRWPLVPAYVLLALALLVALLGLGILVEALIPPYVLFASAIPFLALYAWDRSQWWAIVPAGILTAIGFFLLIAEEALEWAVPVLLILAGVWILARVLARRSGKAWVDAREEQDRHGPE